MRVLALVSSLDPLRGGTQSATVNSLLAARRAGVGIEVAVPERTTARERSRVLVDSLEQAGITVRTFPPLARPAELADRWSLSPAQVVWVARNLRRYDVVHINAVWALGLLATLVMARLTRIPTVVTPHESLTAFDIDRSRTNLRRRQKLLLKVLYKRWTTLFVLTSQLEAEDSLPGSTRLRTIPFPIADPRRPLPPLRPRAQGHTLRVGFLGRFDPKKNLDLLIDAVAELPGHVRLLVAGDGPADLVAQMHRRAKDVGVQDRIEWLGFVSATERPAFLAGLDVLAMPSVFESFGMSAAEAMLHGVPVLVSERTGIAEVIRRHGGGEIVAPHTRAIADALARLDADRPRLDALAAEGQAAAQSELGFVEVGAALKDAYELASGGRC